MPTTFSAKCITLLALSLTVYHAAVVAVEDAIFHGKPEVLVSPGLVRRDGLSLDKCAKACLEEKTIKCQFFKFVNSSKTCYLSETDHPVRTYLDKITQPSMASSDKSAEAEVDTGDDNNRKTSRKELVKMAKKLKQLNKTAKKLEKVDKKLKGLKNSSTKKSADLKKLDRQNKREEMAILSLRDRIALLSKKSKHLNNEMNKMEKTQKAVSTTIKSMETSDVELSQNVEKLSNLVTDLQENTESINKFNETFQQELQSVATDSKKIFAKLDRLAHQLKTGKYHGGISKQIKANQVQIARFCAKIAEKDKHLANRINSLWNKIEKMTRTMGKSKYDSKTVMSAVSKIKQSMVELKKIVEAVENPMSKKNRKWQKDIDTIKNVISRLSDGGNRLRGEMKDSEKNLANMIKELTNVRMSCQALKGQLSRVKNANTMLRKEVEELIKAKGKMPSIIQMTKMSTTILKALSTLEQKEKDLSHRVKGFHDSLKKLEKMVVSNTNLSRTYGKAMEHRDHQIKFLAGQLKRTEKALLLLADKVVPKHIIDDMDKKQEKYSTGMNKMHKQIEAVRHQLKELAKTSEPGYVEHVNSFLTTYTSKVVKAMKLLQEKVASANTKNKQLKETVKKLVKRVDSLSDKISERWVFWSNRSKKPLKRRHYRYFKKRKIRKGRRSRKGKKGKPGKIIKVKKSKKTPKRVKNPKSKKTPKRVKNPKSKKITKSKKIAKKISKSKKIAKKSKKISKRKKNTISKKNTKSKKKTKNVKKVKSKKRSKRSSPVELEAADSNHKGPSVENNGSKNLTGHSNFTTEAKNCPKDFNSVGRYCFLFVSQLQPHDGAEQECQKYGAKLVDVNSEQKQFDLSSFAKGYKPDGFSGLWIAAMKYNSKKQLIWENTGNAVLYKNFHTFKDQTNSPGERICTEFHLDLSGGWIGYSCDSKLHSKTRLPFVCEIDTKL